MKILAEKQLANGDYQLDCEFTDEEVQVLLNYAVVNILKEQIKNEKKIQRKKKK
jgi:hypothetical protein